MEIVINTCVLEDTARGVIEAQEFVEFVFKRLRECKINICVDIDGKIRAEYEQKIHPHCYGGLLIQKAVDWGKIKALKSNRSHPVCKKLKQISPVLDEHDLTFLAVTLKTQGKKFFTNDTGFYEPVGEQNIRRDSEGKPIPLEPIRKAGLCLFDVESWEKRF